MSKIVSLFMPIKGKILPLNEVNDYLFNKKVIGEGIAIQPSDGCVYSPIDGTIALIYSSGHAVIINTEDGLQVLIHIGLDTAKLEGRGFGSYVKVGDKVKAGDKIIFFDPIFVERKSTIITPVIIMNPELIQTIDVNFKVDKPNTKFMDITLK